MIREQIMDFLINKLKQIKTQNGFYTNAGQNVYEWKNDPLPPERLPALIVRDALVRADDGIIGAHRWVLGIEIACAGRNAREMRRIIADVFKVISECEQERFGINNAFIELSRSDMQVERHDIELSAAVLYFSVVYDAPRWGI